MDPLASDSPSSRRHIAQTRPWSQTARRPEERLAHPGLHRPQATNGGLLKDRFPRRFTRAEVQALWQVERNRPPALRAYDQISMRGPDLLQQVNLLGPYLAGKTVAFVGDNDSSALLLGLLSQQGAPAPARMLILDFDERILEAAYHLSNAGGFSDRLELRLYNVFDPLPQDLLGRYDWYYVNPPYGSRNQGASARLFITRGCELVGATEASGCIITPDDNQRSWTRQAMYQTQQFLLTHGWIVSEKIDQVHQYHLDDDSELASSLMIVRQVPVAEGARLPMLYAGRRVRPEEIPYFYGCSVRPPYPQYISRIGLPIYR